MSRCTGHCCELFYLPFTAKQIRQVRKLKIKNSRGHITFRGGKAINADNGGICEIREVAEMVIPVSPSKENVINTFGGILNLANDHYYTCKNFDTETRNCKIYNSRPHMCRNHPSSVYEHAGQIPLEQLKEKAATSKCEYRACTGCQNGELQ